MATIESPPTPRLGEHGEPCAVCATPLAADQRYCLNCGTRRAGPRIALDEALDFATSPAAAPPAPPAGPAGPATPVPPPGDPRGLTPLASVLAVSAVVVALGIGVVLGRGSDAGTAAAPRPQVITVGGAAATGAAATGAAATAEFTSDWPAGTTGFTVQLRTLPKDSSDAAAVTAAKTAAEGKGAASVGALDSDEYASLDTGNYVVYSGVFKTRAGAAKALKKLKGDFPGAKVVAVSTDAAAATAGAAEPKDTGAAPKTLDQNQLKKLQNASPEEYQKQSRKLPPVIGTEGTPPPTDNKPAGGGGGATEIG